MHPDGKTAELNRNINGAATALTVHATETDGSIVAYAVTDIHDSFPREAE